MKQNRITGVMVGLALGIAFGATFTRIKMNKAE